MSISLREMLARVISFARKRECDRDFDEELSVHVELAAEENHRRGMNLEEARSKALMDLGGTELAKELHRDARGLPGLDSVLRDLRYALRQLWKSPGFTLTAVLSFALGIGGTTAMFSLVYSVLLHPYSYTGADRMVRISTEDRNGNLRRISLTGAQFLSMRKAASVADAVAWQNWELNTTGSGLPEDVKAVFITPNASAYFGLPALRGRGLVPSDAPNGHTPQPVVVLSYLFWQRHFAGSPEVVGKTFQMAHKDYTIVGVLPPEFTWNGGDVYLPLTLTYDLVQPYGVSIKLKRGVSIQAANAEFQGLLHQFAKETPSHFPEEFHAHTERLSDEYVHSLGRALALLFGAVAFLMLVGCANVSILLLSRGALRQHELAVRAAVGASRARILRQLITESLLLSLGGAVLGVVVAYSILPVVLKWLPLYSSSQEAVVQISVPVLIFCVGLAVLTGFLSGFSPALQMSRSDLARVIQRSTSRIAGGAQTRRAHSALIAGQLALTMLLLSGAGATMEGLAHLMHSRLGYDPHDTIDIDIPLHNNTYTTWEQRAAYFERLRNAIATVPEAMDVAISSRAVPPANGIEERFEIRARPVEEAQQSRVSFTSSNYFSALHIALLRGRVWNRTEGIRGARLAVINESMVRRYWPRGDAVGHAIRMPELQGRPPFVLAAPHSNQWFQIVGVVADSRNDRLLAPVKPAVYVPYTILMEVNVELLVRTQVPPLSVLRAIRAKVYSVDSNQQVDGYTPTLEELIKIQPERRREQLISFLFGAFAIAALVLAVTGLQSVVAYGVAQRTNEFGIRMALGAQRSNVLWIVLRSTWLSVGSGIAAGLMMAITLRDLLTKWTAISSGNPLILAGVAVLLVCVSTCACLIPARRAASIDPMTALRQE